MRDYGKVYSAFWHDEDMRKLSEDGRTLALYLMTSPHGNMLGCFRLTDAYAGDDLQWGIERVRKGFDELFQAAFAYRCESTSWVVIRKYLDWNQFENPNVGKAAGKMFVSIHAPVQVKAVVARALREFSSVFPTQILDAFESSSKGFQNPFDLSSKTIAIAIAQPEPEPEPEPEPNPLVERRVASPDRDVIAEIFAYWQKTMNSPKAVLDTKRKSLIKAALKSYEPRQICEAILGCSKSAHHMGDNNRNTKYNQLGLILRNSDYIEKFIELASKKTVGAETLEQKNARIIAEFMADETLRGDDPNVIDMEES